MKHIVKIFAVSAFLAFVVGIAPTFAQEQNAGPDGSAAAKEVSSGTRFLISLDDALSSKGSKPGDHFHARTLEPIIAADGTGLRVGAEIRGHVDKVEMAHKTGRARMWLTLDEINTPDGWLPVVAMVDDAPGVHSIRVDYNREGEIEVDGSKRDVALQAAAAGALVGAATGVASHNEKDAAMGAAVAAATAYMVTSGLGQELTLDKGTKLELILERPLYFARN
jgi:hypothetical protein